MEAKLQWVVVEGKVVHVGTFAGLEPRQRPPAMCPACGRKVTMKLGTKVVHHCAHRPGDLCAMTAPESALHMNTKLHLAKVLESLQVLRVSEPCARSGYRQSRGCEGAHTLEWVSGWDQVAVELSLGSRRPDITLLRDGLPMALIEVHATNAVDDAKASDLLALGSKWLEVHAAPSIYSGDSPWDGTEPLEGKLGGLENPWTCGPCRALVEEERSRREQERHTRLNGRHERLVRIVDYYFRTGKKYRDVYYVFEQRRDGQVVELSLMRRGRKGEVLIRVPGPPGSEAMRQLRDRYRQELDSVRRRGAVVDSPMKWHRADSMMHNSDLVVYAGIHYPHRYRWNRRQRVWFIPKDLRDTDWERNDG